MAKKLAFSLLAVLFFLLLIIAGFGQSRLPSSSSSSSGSVSDGVKNVQQPTVLLLKGLVPSDTCDETYGFFPCSTTTVGNIFLIGTYGYLMHLAAKFLSDGSEVLLEILGPGIVGGLILPLLSSLSDAITVLASGLSESKEIAQSKVSVGMGLLAGSTVLTLTILWGSCVVVGKCDLNGSTAVDSKDTKGFSLTGSGVSTDIWTQISALIMVLSLIPFAVVQVLQSFGTKTQSRLAILISLMLSLSLLVSYCLFQIFQPKIQRRRLAYAKHKHLMAGILRHLKMRSLGKFLTHDGTPNEDVLRKLFHMIDENSDGYLSVSEIRALIVGIQFEVNLDEDDAVNNIMKDFDKSGDSQIDLREFISGISKWLDKAKCSAKKSKVGTKKSKVGTTDMKLLSDFHEQTKKEHDMLGDQADDMLGAEDDENVEKIENPRWNAFKAVLVMLLGIVIAVVFADPFVDSISNFSTATSVPSFFVSFIVLPFVRSGEGISAVIFAGHKKQRTASLTFSQIYAAVTVSHTLCFSVFLSLLYIRDLTWDFSSEVWIILIVSIVVGGFASIRTTFPLWTCLVVYALYPFSPVLVYILDYVIAQS